MMLLIRAQCYEEGTRYLCAKYNFYAHFIFLFLNSPQTNKNVGQYKFIICDLFTLCRRCMYALKMYIPLDCIVFGRNIAGNADGFKNKNNISFFRWFLFSLLLAYMHWTKLGGKNIEWKK